VAVDATFAIGAFAALFAIVDPVGNLPFFVSITQDYPGEMKRRVARNAVVTATVILLLFGLAGNLIFQAFQTSIHAFRIAGGLLLFAIGFTTIYGERSGARITDREREDAAEREQVGVVPLGIPLLAGPGAITTVVVLTGGPSFLVDPMRFAVVLGAVGLTMAISYPLLAHADRLFSRFGRAGTLAFSRIMGLILAAMAVQFVILGIQGAYEDCFLNPPCGP
jgi:multiple antibiotic resistance protein